jgi:hypothetical protein
MMKRSNYKVVLLTGLMLLLGCGNESTAPGPDSGASFSVWMVPPSVAPGVNAQVKLQDDYPIPFAELGGHIVIFRSSSGTGIFSQPYCTLDLNTESHLSPPVWYQYTGSAVGIVDTIYVYVLNAAQSDTSAWNRGTLTISGD